MIEFGLHLPNAMIPIAGMMSQLANRQAPECSGLQIDQSIRNKLQCKQVLVHDQSHLADPDEDGQQDEGDAEQAQEGDFRQFRNVPVQTERNRYQ